MKDDSKKPIISSEIKWFAGQDFYKGLHEKRMDFYDEIKSGNLFSALLTFKFIYNETYAYIQRFMGEGEEEHLNTHIEILELRKSLKPANTDSESLFNDNINMQMLDMLLGKWRRLEVLMAKAQLHIPIDKTDRSKPAALAGDWT